MNSQNIKEDIVLKTSGVMKTYGKFTALHPTTVRVKRGSITGLVGRNGAGKTTLLRMITGQTLPTRGEMELFGETASSGLSRARRRTGAIIEAPSFYPYMTARQNLEYYRMQRGVPGKDCIDKALASVKLIDTGNKKYKGFSLGMKQRLGVALALLNNPDFLILDEPLNGLDPMGIAELRHLLLSLNQEQNVTILVSSHILSELGSIATDYIFLNKGNVVEIISAAALREKCRTYIEIKVDKTDSASVLLERQPDFCDYEVRPDNRIRIFTGLDSPERVSVIMAENGISLYSIGVKGSNLEDYFLSLVEGGAEIA